MANSFKATNNREKLEECEYHVCAPAHHLTDEMIKHLGTPSFTDCCMCGQRICYRDSIGPTNPKYICIQCALPDMKEAADEGELNILTSESAWECATGFWKKE